MDIKEIKKLEKNFLNYQCDYCNFKCSQKCDWERHIIRPKHVNAVNGNHVEIKKLEKHFFCDCGKKFMTNSGLWKHKSNNTCSTKNFIVKEETKCDEITDKNLIMMLINENKELKTMMVEQQNIMMKVIENGTHNITNNTTHTNSHNKAFNLNFFLNETCKDAMNIMDFVESIQLQLSDLERVGEKGYIDGISNIIIKNLKELDVTQRPVHCTDKKRETIYVKDEDKWEKDEENKKLHKVVRKVTCKNQNLIPKFKETHPDCNTYHSKFSDQYNKIIIESMGGKGDNDYEKEEKIIKNISKQVTIEKE